MEYKNKQFKKVSEIMKTSFSLRVDKQRQVNEGFDADYFGTHQRNEKLIKFKAEISALEV